MECLLLWTLILALLCPAPLRAQRESPATPEAFGTRTDSVSDTSDLKVFDTDVADVDGGFKNKGFDYEEDVTENGLVHARASGVGALWPWHLPSATETTDAPETGFLRPWDHDDNDLGAVDVQRETRRSTTGRPPSGEHLVRATDNESGDITPRTPEGTLKKDKKRQNGSERLSKLDVYIEQPEREDDEEHKASAEGDSPLHANASALLKESSGEEVLVTEKDTDTTRSATTEENYTPEADTTTIQGNTAEGTEGGEREPALVAIYEAENSCREPCFRKCCPLGQAYDVSTGSCRRTQERWEPPEGTKVVVGLPRCSLNTTVTSVTRTDGRRRLKLGSYGVAYEMFCTDHLLLKKDPPSFRSLVCEDILEESRIVNIIRKTSIIGNVVSALCISAIYVCHAFIPKLNEKQGCIFIIFCSMVFTKAVIEAPERWIQFTSYPNYTVCVINSVVLMFFQTSVPIWLSVLCVDIARRASTIGNLFRMVNARSGNRRWLLVYVAYGVGLPVLQLLLAFCITTLGERSPPQLAVYDRMCVFTNEDVLNWVFLYPRIGLASSCSLLMLYAHKHRKIWCNPTVVDGRRVVHVDIGDRAGENGGDGGQKQVNNRNNLELFRAHSAFDFVAEFWQQVGLVFFWIMLMISTMLMQLTGDGVLSHITNLMDCYQGLYVFIIFVFNRQKRDLVRKKLRESMNSFKEKKAPYLTYGLPGRSGTLNVKELPSRSTCPRREAHQQAVLSAEVSSLKLTGYSLRKSVIPNGFHGSNHISVPLGVCPPTEHSLPNEVSSVEDSSQTSNPSLEALTHSRDCPSAERLDFNRVSVSSEETLMSLVSREVEATSSEAPSSEITDHEPNVYTSETPSCIPVQESPKSPKISTSPEESQSPLVTDSSSFHRDPSPLEAQASKTLSSSETSKFLGSVAPKVPPAPIESPISSRPPSDLPTSEAALDPDALKCPKMSRSAMNHMSSESLSLPGTPPSPSLASSPTSPTSLDKFILLTDSPQQEIVLNQECLKCRMSEKGRFSDGGLVGEVI
ncbi:uncharacterized protein LOC143028163 isoform X2 [Oratosquilla oratoria]|uniref:uncharacterized protein LOC143028163 isoform X2 n=1 Tax=Oratosquilla oratoria TaxID=337810 RepID=UPI003F762A8C